jgi:hypothetical protein
MPKTKSIFDKFTWIITEMILGIAILSYGLYAIILEVLPIYFSAALCVVGGLLLIASIIQILIRRKKKIKKYCSKCGQKTKKGDEFCSKCGEKIT